MLVLKTDDIHYTNGNCFWAGFRLRPPSLYESKRLEDAFTVEAEDFISKSCQPEELVNRLKALYKRALKQQQKNEICELSEFTTFHITSGVLTIGGHKEILKLNEAKLLAVLCRFINKNVSSVDLGKGIWGKGNV